MPLLHDTDITENILYQEGYEEGIKQGIESVVIFALNKGENYDEIIDLTGLTRAEIEKIDQKRNSQ